MQLSDWLTIIGNASGVGFYADLRKRAIFLLKQPATEMANRSGRSLLDTALENWSQTL